QYYTTALNGFEMQICSEWLKVLRINPGVSPRAQTCSQGELRILGKKPVVCKRTLIWAVFQMSTCSLTHSLTHILTHSLTHSHTHSLTHSLTHYISVRTWHPHCATPAVHAGISTLLQHLNYFHSHQETGIWPLRLKRGALFPAF
uniref:Uncharacterized protein n=1 Tax=Paramormyrops kingsleyae TaxID=1676925 RepID=A0A3B3SCV7_9TELE